MKNRNKKGRIHINRNAKKVESWKIGKYDFSFFEKRNLRFFMRKNRKLRFLIFGKFGRPSACILLDFYRWPAQRGSGSNSRFLVWTPVRSESGFTPRTGIHIRKLDHQDILSRFLDLISEISWLRFFCFGEPSIDSMAGIATTTFVVVILGI